MTICTIAAVLDGTYHGERVYSRVPDPRLHDSSDSPPSDRSVVFSRTIVAFGAHMMVLTSRLPNKAGATRPGMPRWCSIAWTAWFEMDLCPWATAATAETTIALWTTSVVETVTGNVTHPAANVLPQLSQPWSHLLPGG